MEITERPVQLRGSALARALLRAAGWRLRWGGLPARQGVLIVYPHTSNWDFVVGVLAKWSLGLPVTFWAKDSLFRIPGLGAWLRWLGGVAIDRSAPNGIVGQMAAEFAAARREDRFLWLALTPEGTRSYRDAWRSGFYHVCQAADLPLGLVYFDYAERVVGVERFIRLSGEVEADMDEIRRHFAPRVGKRPALATPIRFKP